MALSPITSDVACTVPVHRTDAHLPPVPAERLRWPALTQRLRAAASHPPEREGDGLARATGLARDAAVLIGLREGPHGEGDLRVVLTQRSAHLRHHGGQISFPGGRVDADDRDAVAAALREAQEEVGLWPGCVQPLGQLPRYMTVTGFSVHPIVARIKGSVQWQINAHEVDDVLEPPLAFLMDPAHHHHHRIAWAGGEREFLSIPWTGRSLAGREQAHFIWGATAAMLRNLYAVLMR